VKEQEHEAEVTKDPSANESPTVSHLDDGVPRRGNMARKRMRRIPQLTLGGERGLGKIHVGIEPFFDFSFWLAEELDDLVGYWSKRMPRTVERRAARVPTIVDEE
jgi:hypothetical protein